MRAKRMMEQRQHEPWDWALRSGPMRRNQRRSLTGRGNKSQPVMARMAGQSCHSVAKLLRVRHCHCPGAAIGRKSTDRFPPEHCMTFDSHQGDHPRHRRGPDRVRAGLVDRPSAAGAALLRLRRRGLRQDLRGADPVRRHPRAAVDLFRPAVAIWRSASSPIRQARRFVIGVLIAFLPAAVVGALAHDFIKSVLFNPNGSICFTLIAGGAVLLWIDMLDLKPRYHDARSSRCRCIS